MVWKRLIKWRAIWIFVADDNLLNGRNNALLTVTVVTLFGSCHLGEMVVFIGRTPVLWRYPLKRHHHHILLTERLTISSWTFLFCTSSLLTPVWRIPANKLSESMKYSKFGVSDGRLAYTQTVTFVKDFKYLTTTLKPPPLWVTALHPPLLSTWKVVLKNHPLVHQLNYPWSTELYHSETDYAFSDPKFQLHYKFHSMSAAKLQYFGLPCLELDARHLNTLLLRW